jgi:hypothetical protein
MIALESTNKSPFSRRGWKHEADVHVTIKNLPLTLQAMRAHWSTSMIQPGVSKARNTCDGWARPYVHASDFLPGFRLPSNAMKSLLSDLSSA